MARKWLCGLLFGFAALLPGCQHLSALRSERPAKQHEPRETAQESPIPESTFNQWKAQSRAETNRLIQAGQISQHPVSPTPTERLPDSPKPAPPRVVNTGIPGVAVDSQVQRAEAKLAAAQPGNPPTGPLHLPILDPRKDDKQRQYAPLLRALDAILGNRPEEARQHLEIYDKKTQDFFLRFTPMLVTIVKTPIDELTPQGVTVLNSQLRDLLDLLRPRTELNISKICYCRRVNGFANYVELPENHAFLTGSEQRPGELVQVYVELANFSSEPTQDAYFLTKLACTLTLRDGTGKEVWKHQFDRRETTHRRKSRINDFYSTYSFFVPALAPGTYQLTMQIVDETTPDFIRAAHRSLDFRVTPIAGQTSMR